MIVADTSVIVADTSAILSDKIIEAGKKNDGEHTWFNAEHTQQTFVREKSLER